MKTVPVSRTWPTAKPSVILTLTLSQPNGEGKESCICSERLALHRKGSCSKHPERQIKARKRANFYHRGATPVGHTLRTVRYHHSQNWLSHIFGSSSARARM